MSEDNHRDGADPQDTGRRARGLPDTTMRSRGGLSAVSLCCT